MRRSLIRLCVTFSGFGVWVLEPALAFAQTAPGVAPASQAGEQGQNLLIDWVPWNTGGNQADLGYGIIGHLGFGHRMDESALEPRQRNGVLYGITALVRPMRQFAIGLGLEHLDLGADRQDIPPTSFVDVTRDENTVWAQLRLYAYRDDPLTGYLGLSLGPTWQSLDSSRRVSDLTTGQTTTTTCEGKASAALAWRAGIGIESQLSGSSFLNVELGPEGYRLSDGVLDSCEEGASNAFVFGLRAGIGLGIERTHVAPPPPPPPPDTDHDGVADPDDACPAASGPASVDRAKKGCPDSDGDGFIDTQDACPQVAGIANADPAKNGCPPPADKDADGIPDAEDACPDVKGVASGDKAKNGCPPDADGDTIFDDKDACPNEKGVPNEDPTKNGCPLVVLTDKEIVINQQVQFDTDQATIKPVSGGLLDDVAGVMKGHPEILKVEVQGHTDNTGTKARNKELSRKRAEAVVKALVERGVEKPRLDAKGYGQDKPLADNATPEGQAKNRRVQFVISKKK